MNCPDVVILAQFLEGDLLPRPTAEIEEHLSTCSSCSVRLSAMREDEAVAAGVRLAYPPSDPPSPAHPVPSIRSYRIQREIGRGGMGVVYEAVQLDPPRTVAVKTLRAPHSRDGRRVRHFRREAFALARLQHAGIARVYECGCTEDGRPFFSMELVRGKRLDDFLRDRSPSLPERLQLFVAICEAVAYAHERGIVHRDLKPSNILVSSDGVPKILDFGVARMLNTESADRTFASLTNAGRLIGTVPYMSPEQVRGQNERVDARSDVYALGVVLYEMLTGHLPYALVADDLIQSARVISETRPVAASAWNAHLRGDLDVVVLKALEKEPPRRYASAAALAADVARHLRHEPILARPPTRAYRFARFARRNRGLVTGIVIAAIALLSGTAAAVGQAVSATRQRDAAERRLAIAEQAANYVFAGVGSQLGSVLGTGRIRRHLAEEAYHFYDRLAAESPGSLEARTRRWSALRQLAERSLEIGDLERADLLSTLALQEATAACEASPDSMVVARELMYLHLTAARICADAGAANAMIDHTMSAREIRDEVMGWFGQRVTAGMPAAASLPQHGPNAGAMPLQIQVPRDWAQLFALQIAPHVIAVDPDLAERLLCEAAELTAACAVGDPTLAPTYREDLTGYAPLAQSLLLRNGSEPSYERTRAAIQAGLGEIAFQRGEPLEAHSRYLQAFEVARRLHEQDPLQPATAELLGSIGRGLAIVSDACGHPEQARQFARLAADTYQALVRSEPGHVRWSRAAETTAELGH